MTRKLWGLVAVGLLMSVCLPIPVLAAGSSDGDGTGGWDPPPGAVNHMNRRLIEKRQAEKEQALLEEIGATPKCARSAPET